jgi:hypothetical protein
MDLKVSESDQKLNSNFIKYYKRSSYKVDTLRHQTCTSLGEFQNSANLDPTHAQGIDFSHALGPTMGTIFKSAKN